MKTLFSHRASLFIFPLVLAVVVGKIPYVNLFAQECILLVFVICFILWYLQAKPPISKIVTILLALITIESVLMTVGIHFFAEVLGNIIFILLFFIAVIYLKNTPIPHD